MLPEIFLILTYTILFSAIIWFWKFYPRGRKAKQFLILIFWLKILAGIGYGQYHIHHVDGGDTFRYFEDGNLVFKTLRNNPIKYLHLLTARSSGTIPSDIAPELHAMHVWNSSGNYTMVRFNGFVRLFSFGFYNVHVVFMAFLVLTGLLAFYKFLYDAAFENKKALVFAVFLVPSVLFYGSGLHKESLLIAGLGFLLWAFARIIRQDFRLASWIGFITGALLVYIVREFYLVALIPGLLAYASIQFVKSGKQITFALMLLTFWIAFFMLHFLIPQFDPLKNMIEKQQEFLILQGHSNISITPLHHNFFSLLLHVPMALINVILRPFPNEATTFGLIIYAIENLLLLCFFILSMVYTRILPEALRHKSWLLLSFSITAFIIIGCIVPNMGAISRYRSPAILAWTAFISLKLAPQKLTIFRWIPEIIF